MKKLIVEVFRGQSLIVAESQQSVPDGMIRMQGVFGVVDSVNRNNRFYPKADYAKHVKLLQERIDKFNNVFGELEHPQSMTVDLNNLSHKVEKVWLDESTGNVMGQILLLDTPKGKIAQSVAKTGSPLHISSRAIGTIDEKGAVKLEDLATYDVVGTPGFEEASLYRMNESLDSKGSVVMESFAYDLDADGKVVKQIDKSLFESLENKLNLTIDQRIAEAVQKHSGVSKADVLSVVKDYVTTTAAPDIQAYLKEELSKTVNANGSTFVTRDEMEKFMDERFIKKYAPIIEKWSANEFAPLIEKWLADEFAPVIEKWVADEYSQTVQTWVLDCYSPQVEKWVANEFAPVVENWISNDFAPVIEKWIADEYSPSVQAWMSEHFAESVQSWVVNQYTPVIEKWLRKNVETSTVKRNSPVFNESLILDSLDSLVANADKSQKTVVVESEIQKQKRQLNEHFATGPVWLRYIPENFKQIWVALSPSDKEQIARQASVRTFEHAEAVSKFWQTRNFDALVEANDKLKQLKRDRTQKIDESTQLPNSHQSLIALTKSLRYQ